MTRPRKHSLRRAALAAAAAATVAPIAATAHEDEAGMVSTAHGALVSMGYITYEPARTDVLVGETVTWANESARNHTVTADDGSFDSGPLVVGERFARAFEGEGEVHYHCQLHAGMSGTVGVHTILLRPFERAAGPGLLFPVTGRAALAPGTDVTVEADTGTGTGTGFVPFAHAPVAADGSFSTTITPRTSMQLRAVAGTAASPAVGLRVLDRHVTFTVRRRTGGVTVEAAVTPATPGGTVVLQLYLPEHFGWWPVHQALLGARSRASFVQPLSRRVRARVLLTLPDGATPLAISRVRRIGSASRGSRGSRRRGSSRDSTPTLRPPGSGARQRRPARPGGRAAQPPRPPADYPG